MPRCSGNFLSHLFIRAWNFTKSRTLPSLFFLSWEIFENGWLLTASSEQLRKVDFDVFQFSTIAISFSCYFYNGKLNVKKTFLQIALLESTPYRISVSMSFLEDLTQVIFNDSLKPNEQLASTIDQLLKLYSKKTLCFMYKKNLNCWSRFVIYILKNTSR